MINKNTILCTSTWTIDDVDLCLENTEITLTETQKEECLKELVKLLSEEIGMVYLREIITNKG